MKVIEKLKVQYPCQDNDLGSIQVKIILCHNEKTDKYFACIGSGEDEWLMENGKPLKYEELAHFFTGYELLKDKYVI